jgi:hypothetical protein
MYLICFAVAVFGSMGLSEDGPVLIIRNNWNFCLMLGVASVNMRALNSYVFSGAKYTIQSSRFIYYCLLHNSSLFSSLPKHCSLRSNISKRRQNCNVTYRMSCV